MGRKRRPRSRTELAVAPPTSAASLREILFTKRVPPHELRRTHFGRAVDMGRIETAIRYAQLGWMRDLTDLATETVAVDPHLASVLQKRFGAIAACDWDLTPAEGNGIDSKKAAFYADVVRSQLSGIREFKQAILDLAWGLFDGRSALEVHWRMAPGPVRWIAEGLGWIHPRRLFFGPDRELRVVDELVPIPAFTEIGCALRDVPYKFVEFKPRLFREYPEREGLAPRCLYWSFFKRFSARERMVLLELFGKPWRIVEVDKDAPVGEAELDKALEMADALGNATAARFPRGSKLVVVSPDAKSGDLHNATIADCDLQLSKLVLGGTGTTDAVANRAESQVHAGQQNVLLQSDGSGISERFQNDLTTPIIVVNFGESERSHAPKFQLRTAPPLDRLREQQRLRSVVDMGVPIAVATVYEVSGFRPPMPGEPIVELPAPAAPPPGPPGQRPPDDAAPDDEELDPEPPPDAAERGAAAMTIRTLGAQPRTVNGSPEDLISRGVREGTRYTAGWAEHLASRVAGEASPTVIHRALALAAAGLDVGPLARSLERRMLHSAMLGATDSLWESEHDEVIAPATFAAGLGQDDFATKPFAEALRIFRAKRILPKSAFERLNGAAKRRAFTVAGLAKDEMLKAAHAELTKALELGSDLRDFHAALVARFDSAGWTQLNASHVETVFRNAAMGAYNSGRHVEMTQPVVLRARPYWQITGARDDRTRPTHRAAQGKVLAADDPFWVRVRYPAGHNCRCRVVSRSQRDLDRLGLSVTSGALITGLPDPGWDNSSFLE